MPQYEKTECECNVQFTKNASKVGVHYDGPNYQNCGMWFKFPTTTFDCDSDGLYTIDTYFEKIDFFRSHYSDASACVVIYLGKLLHIII